MHKAVDVRVKAEKLLSRRRQSNYSKSLLYAFMAVLVIGQVGSGFYTNIDCSFILGMVQNNCPRGEIHPWPTIHRGPTEQSIFVLYKSFIVFFLVCTEPYNLESWPTSSKFHSCDSFFESQEIV